jgi:hypothetical protein
VRLDGTETVVRGFARWFAWSPMAQAVRAAVARPIAPPRKTVLTVAS